MNVSREYVESVLLGRGMVGMQSDGAELIARLHTAHPGEYGQEPQAEIRYNGYKAKTIARSDSAWKLNDQGAYQNADGFSFGVCRDFKSPQIITHISLCIGNRILEIFEIGGQVGLEVEPTVAAGKLQIFPV